MSTGSFFVSFGVGVVLGWLGTALWRRRERRRLARMTRDFQEAHHG